nr:LysR family transcriptional regulator [Kurthia senegalensis]
MNDLLQTFMKVYEQRNFTKASQLLFISQPTISTKIKQLEKQLNTELFIRQGPKNIVPTPAGDLFYTYAKQTIHHYEETLSLMQEKPRQTCRIGCSHTIAHAYLPRIIPMLSTTFPNVDFSFTQANSETIATSVKQQQLDIGFIEKPIDTAPLQKHVFTEDELVLAGKKDATVWLMREAQSGVQFFNELYVAEHTIQLPQMPINSNDLIIQLLKQSFGQSIISKKCLDEHPTIPYEHLRDAYTRPLFIIYEDINFLQPIVKQILYYFEQ